LRTFTIITILMLLIGLSARAQAPSDIQSKLKALEDAYKAGILSEAEYASKKAELEKQSQVLDESKQQKLKALEAAYQAGILSEEEYARKKAELLGAPAATTPMPGIAAKYSDPQGRFEFQYPGDWNVQPLPQGQGITLTRGKAALSVMVLPEGISAQQFLDASMGQISAQWQNYQELRRGNQNIGGVASPVVEFTGINPQGMPAHAQTAVFVSGAKGYMFMLTAPEDDPSNNFSTVQPLWQSLMSTFSLAGEKGKAYRHSTGFSFLIPEGWSVTEQEGFLQLTPPNPSSADGAPTEMYFVLIEDASQGGIQNPEDPAVREYLDSQIQSLSPALKRTGTPSPISIKAGKGALVNWGATGTGGEVLARAFVGVVNNYGLVLIGMGLKQQIEARDPILRQMFSSFGFGEPQQTPAVSTIPGQAATGVSAASPAISGDEIGDPNWGFKFRPPQGWKFQKADTHVILGHDTIAGMILVIPHVLTSFQELQSEMQSGLSDEGVQMSLTGSLQSLGSNAVAGEYSGIFSGQQAKARGIGTFSPYGGGAYIVAVTTPDKYGAQLSGAADAIAGAMQYFKVEVSELISHFAGTWAHTTGSTLTNITFGADGSYEDTYEAGYYGDFTNDVGDKTGFWDATGQEKGKGRWIVRGNKEQGVIIIYHANGNEETLQYRVFVEKGQTYWREYLFNGKHYSKIR
jgi:hypothetical protein